MKSFHNSTNETGTLLEIYQDKAATQDEKILAFFKENKGRLFTPFDVQKLVFDNRTPVTSCRRSLTTLTAKGLLYKSNTKQIELYSRPNFTWALVETDSHGNQVNIH